MMGRPRSPAGVMLSELARAPDGVAEVVRRGAVGALEAHLFQDAERGVVPGSDCRPESTASGACCSVNYGAGGFGRVPVALVHVQQFVCQLWFAPARVPDPYVRTLAAWNESAAGETRWRSPTCRLV